MHTPNIYTVLISDMKNVGLLSQSRPPLPLKKEKKRYGMGMRPFKCSFSCKSKNKTKNK